VLCSLATSVLHLCWHHGPQRSCSTYALLSSALPTWLWLNQPIYCLLRSSQLTYSTALNEVKFAILVRCSVHSTRSGGRTWDTSNLFTYNYKSLSPPTWNCSSLPAKSHHLSHRPGRSHGGQAREEVACSSGEGACWATPRRHSCGCGDVHVGGDRGLGVVASIER
jgi:hypothetical protein